jgi:hypothetical protein
MSRARRPPAQAAGAAHEGTLGKWSSGRRTTANPPTPAPKTGKALRLAGEKENLWVSTW